MEIIKPQWHWRTPPEYDPLNIYNIDGIALHHMASATADIWDIEREHLQKDNYTWKGFGYNWWIGFDGSVYEGRGFNLGAGVENNNSHLISVGFQGDYEYYNTFMPREQFEAGRWLIFEYLKPQLPNLQIINGHKYWNATLCPGQYFPLAQMIDENYKAEVSYEESIDLLYKCQVLGDKNYWINDIIVDNVINGEYMQLVIKRFVAMYVLLNTYEEVIDKLYDMGIIGDKSYWLENAVIGGKVSIDYGTTVIKRMGKLLK